LYFRELREAQDIFGFEDEDVLGNMDGIYRLIIIELNLLV
jgi:hypothetical protein